MAPEEEEEEEDNRLVAIAWSHHRLVAPQAPRKAAAVGDTNHKGVDPLQAARCRWLPEALHRQDSIGE